MFDIERWHRSKGRFNGLEMAYGLGPGQSLELFEVTSPGDSHIHQFFERHGEGVNHIGIWAEDVAAAVRKAIDAGAELVSLTADPEGNATARLIPPDDVTAQHFENLGVVTFVNPTGGVLVEYVGRAGEEFMRNWFKDDFEHVVNNPPWAR
jgi:4-hydroxyphenylpyruvate dioxygenase-like putative hemolysin